MYFLSLKSAVDMKLEGAKKLTDALGGNLKKMKGYSRISFLIDKI